MAIERIIGFQWGHANRYIGPYEFENNMDQEAIHMPPKTTLEEPPSEVPAGHFVEWEVARSRWVIRAEAVETPVIVRHASEVPHD